ncbi:MAG: nucleoside deaminase [Desulfovibrionales bacterium]|nr:nucleoside deaminase [Desulfovibrionales bacterium]
MNFYCPTLVSGSDRYLAWEPFMHEALVCARTAQEQGDVPVGAVVVNECGRVLGRGENRTILSNDPTAHAEILAIRAACSTEGNYRLAGAVLVVTLEPCIMCLGAIIQARLAGVVFATPDPKAGSLISRMAGSEIPWSNHHFWMAQGVLADTCSTLLREFFQRRRHEKKIFKNLAER